MGENGFNIRAVFDRFAELVKAVEAQCQKVGRELETSEMYGNVLSCPSNCGTGLRASMMIKIPLATKQPGFKQWCADKNLQARGSGGFASAANDDGIRDISNVDRMGKDEVTLVNEMIQGVIDLIAWEKTLESNVPPAATTEDPAAKGVGFGPCEVVEETALESNMPPAATEEDLADGPCKATSMVTMPGMDEKVGSSHALAIKWWTPAQKVSVVGVLFHT